MTGKQLRNSILQWAIQGKLVPQDPNDELASVLLERIREEKAHLVKEKKIKRDKNESIIYRGDDNSYYEKFVDGKEVCIDDEIPFEIPESWVWVRLEDIAFVGTGSTPDRSNSGYYGGTIPWVNSSLTQNDFICDTPECITEKAIEETSCRIYPIGTLIVAMYGQGKTRGQVSELKIVAATNQACAAINVYESNINSYVKLFFKYNYTTIRKEAAGGAQPNLNLIKIKKIPIPLPPLSEQQRIVAKIEELMPLVEEYDKAQTGLDALNAKLSEVLKKSILQEAIQGRLVAQDASDEPASVLLQRIEEEKLRLVKEGKLKKKDVIDSTIFRGDDNKYWEKRGKEIVCIDDEIPFDIPDSWTWCRIKDIFLINPKNNAQDDIDAAFIPMEKIDATYLSSFTYSTKKWGEIKKGFTHFADGDVAFAKITPCFQNRKSMILRDLPNGIGAGTTELKVLRSYGTTIINEYLLFFLESSYFVDEATFKGTANQQRIISGYLENKLFPLPPLQEQQRIVDAVLSTWQVL